MDSNSQKKIKRDYESSALRQEAEVYYSLPWRTRLKQVVDCPLLGLNGMPLAEVVKSRLHMLTHFDLVQVIEGTCKSCKNNRNCSDLNKIKDSKRELRSNCNQMRKVKDLS